MDLNVGRSNYDEIRCMRELYRHAHRCQIIHDSALERGLADAYAFWVNDQLAGYGGVWNQYFPGRVMEFYVLPAHQTNAFAWFKQLLIVSEATHIEAQTNMPHSLAMLYEYASQIEIEKLLFADAFNSQLTCPAGRLRAATASDQGEGLDGEWVLEVHGQAVASGGFLRHYNPPYADIYMHVAPQHRGQGYGSYLVQGLKRECYAAGHQPAARCDPDNVASRKTMEKAGLALCGHLLVGIVVG